MKPLIDIAKECGVQFGESDVSRDIISRLQLESVVAAAIAQHQAKALEGVEPVAVVGEGFALLWAGAGPIAPICRKHGIKVGQPLYTASTVSALQARIAELGAKLAGVTEAVCELLSNEDHALSGGIPRGYSEGSQTWDLWEQLRQVVGFDAARKEPV